MSKRQEGEQFIAPSAHAFVGDTKKDIDTFKSPTDEDERLLTELSQSDSWEMVKTYMSRLIDNLEKKTVEKIAESPIDIEEIGYRYMILNQIKGALDNVCGYVDKYAMKAKDDVEKKFAKK